MYRSFSKILVVVATLIAFIGQAVAYTTMSCEMSADFHKSSISSMAMEHSSMQNSQTMKHSKMDQSDSTSSENCCCGDDCACPDSACTFVTLLSANIGAVDVLPLSNLVSAQESEQPNSIPTSLYRPPILA